ncbi:MAG: hypothetical protein AVDCRST_MAG89-2722, partial [uncultured Gemmatimonadetes bacterium]
CAFGVPPGQASRSAGSGRPSKQDRGGRRTDRAWWARDGST